jgi:hypothetical protein
LFSFLIFIFKMESKFRNICCTAIDSFEILDKLRTLLSNIREGNNPSLEDESKELIQKFEANYNFINKKDSIKLIKRRLNKRKRIKIKKQRDNSVYHQQLIAILRSKCREIENYRQKREEDEFLKSIVGKTSTLLSFF